MNLYITTNFSPNMVERNSVTLIYEVNISKFVNTVIKASNNNYVIKFGVEHIKELINVTGINIENDVIGSHICSESIKIGDIVLLGIPTQSCLFRYFVITFHPRKN